MQYGANPNDIIKYNGTSELMHFNNFKFNENVFDDLGLDLPLQKTILMRPEPSLASYLNTDCRKSVLSPVMSPIMKESTSCVVRFKCSKAQHSCCVTRIQQVLGSVPALAQWVNDLALPRAVV